MPSENTELPPTTPSPKTLTPTALADLSTPTTVRISPPGTQTTYALDPTTKRGEHKTSSLWLADTTNANSARPLTPGLHHDRAPAWSPDGQTIAFISDRARPGDSCGIYLLSLAAPGAEPVALTDPGKKKKISAFGWSPGGGEIAYLSADEESGEEAARKKGGRDEVVYGEEGVGVDRLRGVDVRTGVVKTLYSGERHVAEFVWGGAGGERLVYVLHRTAEVTESALRYGVEVEVVEVGSGAARRMCGFGGPLTRLVWWGEYVYFLGGVARGKNNSSGQVYRIHHREGREAEAFAFGEKDSATDIRWTASGPAVQVQNGLVDEIWLMADGSEPGRMLYSEACEIKTWDVVDNGTDGMALVVGKGSPSTPTELFSIQNEQQTQLSHHGDAIANLDLTPAEAFHATAEDGTALDGVLVTPASSAGDKPWPTVVLVHGGPYFRISFGFDAIYNWPPWLAAAGYAVLCPNYRGGSGRGEEFASAGRGQMGTKDYSDIVTMVECGIARGLFDGGRVAIGGWSQGGFLSYLAVTRSDFHFRAAVCGSGVTDWDMMCMSSAIPTMEAELAGGAPWEMGAESVRTRHGSAVWHMKEKKIETPILILHSEKDETVPLTQAVGFYRGCRHYGYECQMVVYPREPHMVEERMHRIDMLERIKRFYDLHLG